MENLLNFRLEDEEITPEQIQSLKADWLGNLREEGTFIHKNTDGAILNEIKEGQAFCSNFLGDTTRLDEVELLKKAREIAQMTVNSIVPTPTKVKVGSRDSFTNGDEVSLATDYFDDKSLNAGQKADILIGLAVHESAHILYTDFQRTAEVLNETQEELRGVKQDVMNILEDERIEYLLGEDMPGNADYIGEVKKHFFGDVKSQITEPLTEALPKFLNSLLLTVRFPSQLSDEDIKDNYEELVQIKSILTPYPETTDELVTAADRVMLVIEDLVKKQLEEEQQRQQEEQQQQNEEEDANGQQNGGGSQQSGNQQQPPAPSPQEIASAIKKAMQTQQGKQVQNAIDKDANKSKSGYGKDAKCMNNGSSDESQMINEYINGNGEKMESEYGGYGNIKCYARKRNGNQSAYQRSLQKVRQYIPSVQRVLTLETEEQDYELQGMKNGKLNSNKLVSYILGNSRIFSARGSVTCDTACICILIDESGSMSGRKEEAARDAAVLVNEAVKNIDNIEMFIYGFTDNELNIYHERNAVSKWALGSTKSDGGTPTAMAMDLASKRVRRLTQSPCLMLVMTDGSPDDTEKTRQMDASLRKKDFVPVGIGIDSSCSRISGIFKDSILITDLKVLAPGLGKIVKKNLSKLLIHHDDLDF